MSTQNTLRMRGCCLTGKNCYLSRGSGRGRNKVQSWRRQRKSRRRVPSGAQRWQTLENASKYAPSKSEGFTPERKERFPQAQMPLQDRGIGFPAPNPVNTTMSRRQRGHGSSEVLLQRATAVVAERERKFLMKYEMQP